MFTGIIEELGTVRDIKKDSKGARLSITGKTVLDGLKIGDSITVNGACLTAVSISAAYFEADAAPETLKKTNLGELKSGSKVNLERALRLSDRLGGHLVTGHIEATGKIKEKKSAGNSYLFFIEAPKDILKYVVQKGSIAIDGISLTVVDVTDRSFSIAVIPHTMAVTTLGTKGAGDTVNLETDIIGKYVEKMLLKEDKKIDAEFLKRHGFSK
ncbi:MAG: riboflavin synthase subunit alpha [Nitrospirae bacterium RBG_19FT_COMBO_42_15]|nr:MAG: riboflavin synthase subunit alpha [Nitrospirae bacterium RBG_19FT_COMBO_42_15]